MKQILLLTDFSENSINAMRYALHLFKDSACNFNILHVESSKSYISDDLVMSGNQSIYDSIVKKPKDKLSELVDDLKTEFNNKNFSYETLMDYDGLTEAINQTITSTPIELIVMGSNGVTGATETVFGSNTINVIRKVKCPTLVVPDRFVYQKPLQILLPLDLNDGLNSEVFNELLKFFDRFSETIHVLRINPNNETLVEQQSDKLYIDKLKINHKYHIINGVPMDSVVSCYTQTHNINLTALLVQKESFFERFITGSTTTKISNKLRVPLLVFHS